MHRITTLVAFLLSFLSTVLATDPDLGWIVNIDTAESSAGVDNVGDGIEHVFVAVPLVIRRVTSGATVVTITLESTPYGTPDENESAAEPPKVLHTETVTIPVDQRELDQPVYFDLPTAGWQDLILSVVLTGGGPISGYDAVLAFDPVADAFVVRDLGEYEDLINDANGAFIDGLELEGTDEGDLLLPPDEEEDTTVSGPKDKGTEDSPPGGGGGDHTTLVTVTKKTTVCPTPTPPPPCNGNGTDIKLVRRQTVTQKSYVTATVLYTDRNKKQQPLRYQRIYAIGDIYVGSTKITTRTSSAVLDGAGKAVFTWSTRAGSRIEVHSIYVRGQPPTKAGQAPVYNIATRKKASDPLKTWRIILGLVKNPWKVAAGNSVTITNVFPLKEPFKKLWIFDTFMNLTDFSRRKIYPDGYKPIPVNVWYPYPWDTLKETETSSFLDSGDGYMMLVSRDALNPETMAHEYGHFVHWLARGRNDLVWGGPHQLCGTEYTPSATLCFGEGYATAFGLFALDNTHLVERYMDKTKRYLPPDPPNFVDMENYDCNQHSLRFQEGRVAAAMIDLVDRFADKYDPSRPNLGFIPTTGWVPANLAWRFNPRLIFWTNMAANPVDIEDYWRKLQVKLNSADQDRAWAILDYHYAATQFSRDV